jgi:RimJ/RimL family protein N-acetyltransferase
MLPTRSGKLVTMRDVAAEDLPLVWEWENDSEMGLYLNADPGKRMSMEEVQRRFHQYRTDPTSGLFIICTQDGQTIGMLGFDRLYRDIGTCRLFIGIGVKEYWGQGYGSDAMRIALRYFFRDVGLGKVQLSVYDFNTRAIASYRKCGFEVEGVRRNLAYVEGEWCDSIEMAISAEQFERLEPLWQLTTPFSQNGEASSGETVNPRPKVEGSVVRGADPFNELRTGPSLGSG